MTTLTTNKSIFAVYESFAPPKTPVNERGDESDIDTPRKPLTKIHQLTGTPLRKFLKDFRNGLDSAAFEIKITPKIDGHPFRVAWIEGEAYIETGYSGLMGKEEIKGKDIPEHVTRFFEYVDSQDKELLFAELKKHGLKGVKIMGELLANGEDFTDDGKITYVGTTYDATKLGKYGSVVIIDIKGATMNKLTDLDDETATEIKTFLASEFSDENASYFDIDQFAQKIPLEKDDFPSDLIEKLEAEDPIKLKAKPAEEIKMEINAALTDIFKEKFKNPSIMDPEDESLEGVAFELDGNLYGIHYQSWKDIRTSYYKDIDAVKEYVTRFLADMTGKSENTGLGALVSEIRSNIDVYQPIWEKSYKEFLAKRKELTDKVSNDKSLPKFVQKVGKYRADALLKKFRDEDITSDLNSLLDAIMPVKDMKGKTVCIIPGSFRPPHKGHFEMIRHYSELADEVIVAISGQATVSSRRPDKFGRTMPNYVAGQILKIYCDAYGLKNVTIRPVMKLMQWVSWKIKSLKNAKIMLGVSTKDDTARFDMFMSDRFKKQNPTLEMLPPDDYTADAVKVDGKEVSASWVREHIDDKEALRKIVPDKLTEEQFEKVYELINPPSGEYPPMTNQALADKLFVPESQEVVEGGNMFDDVDSINQENVEATIEDFKKKFCEYAGIGEESVQPLGSTGKRLPGNSSGDLDVGIDASALQKAGLDVSDLNNWYAFVRKFAEENGVRSNEKSNIKLISLRWPIANENEKQAGRFVQIDLFVNKNMKMLQWGMYQQKEEPDKDYDKSVVRVLLLQAIIKCGFVKVLERGEVFKEGPDKPVKMERYRYKQSEGLYKMLLERPMKSSGIHNKGWKEIETTLVTDEPEEIAEFVFGKEYKSDKLLSVREVWDAFKASRFWKDKTIRDEIEKDFEDRMKRFNPPRPKYVNFNEAVTEEEKKDSNDRVAVIITDGKNVIVGQTPQRVGKGLQGNCDLPKGHAQEGEDLKDAAKREVEEEIGLKLDTVKPITGKLKYLKGTTLTFFISWMNKLPEEKELKCKSFYEYNGKQYPEIAAYHHVPLENLDEYLYKGLAKLVNDYGIKEKAAEKCSDPIVEMFFRTYKTVLNESKQ